MHQVKTQKLKATKNNNVIYLYKKYYKCYYNNVLDELKKLSP